MKKPILLLAFLATLAAGLALPALADSNTVNVSVTPMVVAVNVGPTSYRLRYPRTERGGR